jgi:hypothetical protein
MELRKQRNKSNTTVNYMSENICNTLRVIRFLDLVNRPEIQMSRKHSVSETGYVSAFRLLEGDTYRDGCLRKS